MPASSRSTFVGGLVWFHRWLGIGTCLIFAMWFATGAVMLFKPFPAVSADARAAYAAPLQSAAVRIGPTEALQAAGLDAGEVRLVQRAGVPAYVVQANGRTSAVDARTAVALPPLAPARVGSAGPAIDYDQWIVANGIDPYRPVYRLPRSDRAGTVDYVSAITGELVQRTNSADRTWNWAGSVLHWIYFTPLRSNWAAWDQTVWWLSLVAMLVAVAGLTLGIVRTLAAIRLNSGSLTYFRVRWMRWHHLLGLFAGVFVLTWIFSGWLSMDHGRLFSRGEATPEQSQAFTGNERLESVTPEALRQIGPAKQVSFSELAGAAILSVTRPSGTVDRLDAAGRILTDVQFDRLLARAIATAWPGARLSGVEHVSPDDLLRLHEGWPDSVRRAQLAGGAYPDVYVDANSGRLLTVMDGSREDYAWAYYALHTFKFPGLVEHPVLRKAVVLILLMAGLALSLTAVIIGWRRLRRSRDVGTTAD